MHVLIADDDPSIRVLIRRLLSHHRVRDVTEAADGRQALAAFQHRPPDALVVDVRMPGLEGPDLLREIRASATRPDIPVLVVSAVADREVVEDLCRLQVMGYLLKPLDIKDAHERLGAFVKLAETQLAFSQPAA